MSDVFKTVAAVLAHHRGDLTADCVAESCGVTEAQVEQWKDIFQVAGVIALTNALSANGHATNGHSTNGHLSSSEELAGEPTTKPPVRKHSSAFAVPAGAR